MSISKRIPPSPRISIVPPPSSASPLRAGMMTVNVSDLRPWSGGRYRTTAGMSPWCRLRSKPSASWRALISTLTVPSPFFVTALAAAALRRFPAPPLGSPAVRARRRPPRRRRQGHVRAELQPRGRRAGQAEFDQMSAFRSWLSASRSPGNSQSSALRAARPRAEIGFDGHPCDQVAGRAAPKPNCTHARDQLIAFDLLFIGRAGHHRLTGLNSSGDRSPAYSRMMGLPKGYRPSPEEARDITAMRDLLFPLKPDAMARSSTGSCRTSPQTTSRWSS